MVALSRQKNLKSSSKLQIFQNIEIFHGNVIFLRLFPASENFFNFKNFKIRIEI